MEISRFFLITIISTIVNINSKLCVFSDKTTSYSPRNFTTKQIQCEYFKFFIVLLIYRQTFITQNIFRGNSSENWKIFLGNYFYGFDESLESLKRKPKNVEGIFSKPINPLHAAREHTKNRTNNSFEWGWVSCVGWRRRAAHQLEISEYRMNNGREIL